MRFSRPSPTPILPAIACIGPPATKRPRPPSAFSQQPPPGVPVREHSRTTLSRISRNGKQDQGVALDIHCPEFATPEALFGKIDGPAIRILALDGITNPQNVGMIIRAAVAGGMDAILYPQRGVAALGPLVIKASAGVIFRAPIVRCDHLQAALEMAQNRGFSIATLEGRPTRPCLTTNPRVGWCTSLAGKPRASPGRPVKSQMCSWVFRWPDRLNR